MGGAHPTRTVAASFVFRSLETDFKAATFVYWLVSCAKSRSEINKSTFFGVICIRHFSISNYYCLLAGILCLSRSEINNFVLVPIMIKNFVFYCVICLRHSSNTSNYYCLLTGILYLVTQRNKQFCSCSSMFKNFMF